MNENKIHDPYHVIIKLTRSWSDDTTIGMGRNPDANLKDAIVLLIRDELQASVDQNILTGEYEIAEVQPPKLDDQIQEDRFKRNELERTLMMCKRNLISTQVQDKELLEKTWLDMMQILANYPELLTNYTCNELPVNISIADYHTIAAYMKNGKKIQAIKHLRHVTGLGLKDAKDMIEAHTW